MERGDIEVALVYEGGGKFIGASSFWCMKADELFDEGRRYILHALDERTDKTHKHYFAQLRDIWHNLPDRLLQKFPNPDVMRQHALILTGFVTSRTYCADTQAEAKRIAAFIESDDAIYSIVSVQKCNVIELRAASQSYEAMGRKEFQRSKEAVLAWCWDLVGVDADAGAAETGANP